MLSRAHAVAYDGSEDAILSFSTVGDSRQDPKLSSQDPTTQPISAQDAIWLQNTKAWSRVMRSIEDQRSNFLFFDGDMIMGYGRATVPTNNTTIAGIVSSDLMQFYRQYGFWRGMITELLETGTYVVPMAGKSRDPVQFCQYDPLYEIWEERQSRKRECLACEYGRPRL